MSVLESLSLSVTLVSFGKIGTEPPKAKMVLARCPSAAAARRHKRLSKAIFWRFLDVRPLILNTLGYSENDLAGMFVMAAVSVGCGWVLETQFNLELLDQ